MSSGKAYLGRFSKGIGPDGIGVALVDNTMIFGAKRAYESWPIDPLEWTRGSLAIDLRSLMDIIETLILHDYILIDSVSRDYLAWPEMMRRVNGKYGSLDGPVVLDREIVYFENEDDNQALGLSLIHRALDKTAGHIRSGTLAQQAEYLEFARGGASVPEIYSSPGDFAHKLVSSFHPQTYKFPTELKSLVDQFVSEVEPLSPAIGNYALFIFRAFYYQALAHVFGISYVPHTWRAPMLAADLAGPSFSFARYIASVTSMVREDLADRLDHEFGVNIIQAEFPVFASYVASQATSRADLLTIALQIRDTVEAQKFRAWVDGVQERIRTQTDLPKIAEAQRDVEDVLADLRRALALEPKYEGQKVTLKLAVPVPGALASAETDVHTRVPVWVRRLSRRQTHLVFLRHIANESMRIAPFAAAFQRLAPSSA